MKYFYLTVLSSVVLGCTSHQRAPSSESGVFTTEVDDQTAKGIGDLFERLVLQRHGKQGPGVKRAVFLKPHGCAKGKFKIKGGLPERFRKGLFATAAEKNIWVRISSDTVPSTPDMEKSTVGFAMKVLNVPGRKLLTGEEEAQTQDFLLQNHHVFFVDTANDFLEFTESIFNGSFDAYMKKHPEFKAILDAMEKPVANVRSQTYWSTTPYQFGDSDFAKYKVIPCSKIKPEPASTENNYLRQRMERDFQAQTTCFHLQVQLKQGDDMPLDRATVNWDEQISRPQTVGTIILPAQDLTLNESICENMAFTAWHALPEHRPVGTVNGARGIVYKRLSDLRRTRNGLKLTEPVK